MEGDWRTNDLLRIRRHAAPGGTAQEAIGL